MPLPEQTIAWLRQAARLGQAGALADLDALARLDALEARVQQLFDHIADLSNMVSAPAAAAAPVATDDGLLRCYAQAVEDALRRFADNDEIKAAGRRAIYNLGRAHGTPPAVVEALQEDEAALSGAALASSQALNALPAIRAALQLLGQPAPAAAPGPIELQAEARPEVVGFIPDEDAAPAGGLPPTPTIQAVQSGDFLDPAIWTQEAQ